TPFGLGSLAGLLRFYPRNPFQLGLRLGCVPNGLLATLLSASLLLQRLRPALLGLGSPLQVISELAGLAHRGFCERDDELRSVSTSVCRNVSAAQFGLAGGGGQLFGELGQPALSDG